MHVSLGANLPLFHILFSFPFPSPSFPSPSLPSPSLPSPSPIRSHPSPSLPSSPPPTTPGRALERHAEEEERARDLASKVAAHEGKHAELAQDLAKKRRALELEKKTGEGYGY